MNKNILTSLQQKLLESIGKNSFFASTFYLTGGTALAAFYLRHRYSEDLDFFTEQEIDPLQLDVALKSIQKEINISKIDFQQSYNRNLFFLYFGEEILKTEFTYFPFPCIERGRSEYGIEIDSLMDIATNKLFSIYQRTYARDYIDLYCIIQEKKWTIQELVMKAKGKFDWHIDPLQLGTQFIKAQEARDYPHMIREVQSKEWRGFFTEEAKNLRDQIIK